MIWKPTLLGGCRSRANAKSLKTEKAGITGFNE
jgi:hypothetical protein